MWFYGFFCWGRAFGRAFGRAKSIDKKRNVFNGRAFGRAKRIKKHAVLGYNMPDYNLFLCFLSVLEGWKYLWNIDFINI